jgi:hypothetical protein
MWREMRRFQTAALRHLKSASVRRSADDLLKEVVGWVLTTALGAIIGSLLTQQSFKQALSDGSRLL